MDSNVSKYITQQVMTASPAKLVFMLYERAIGSLREAIAAIESGDVQARWRANNRAIEIVSHLWATLNTDGGGEIAANLERLFPLILRQLTQVDVRNDPAPAVEVIAFLEPLRDAWREIARNGAGPARPAAKAAAPRTQRPGAGESPEQLPRTSISV